MGQFDYAKEQYARWGIDPERAIAALREIPISIHCWQGDDIDGFESLADSLSGGIQTTGNYPGKARNPAELMADLDEAFKMIPGKKRLNLHACYAFLEPGEKVDRDQYEPRHFAPWVAFAKERGLQLDFNPTYFAHPKAADSLTLSNPDEEIRAFWIRHGIASRRIAAYFARELGGESLCNQWIPDGYKDIPADRLGPRLRAKDSYDQIFAEKLPGVIDSVESKVFGIGLEAYTVGSAEFYLSYAASHPGVYPLLDNGHYHPTEMVSDKIPSLLAFFDKLPMHVTRPMRWDSDHVVLLDDELKEIAREIVRCNGTDKVMIGLDYFDASINRIAAWVVGTRNMQKALLNALLEPHALLKDLQDQQNFTRLMAEKEALKVAPFGAVWAEYCRREGVASDTEWMEEAERYEREVLSKRA